MRATNLSAHRADGRKVKRVSTEPREEEEEEEEEEGGRKMLSEDLSEVTAAAAAAPLRHLSLSLSLPLSLSLCVVPKEGRRRGDGTLPKTHVRSFPGE